MLARFLGDGRVRDTVLVALTDASFFARHATEIKALEDFILFAASLGFLLWRWRRLAARPPERPPRVDSPR